MQSDVKNGKTAKARTGGRGGKATGGAGVASRCLGTIQAIIGHAKHKGLLANPPTQGAKKLASKKRTRLMSVAEIEMLGKAIDYAEKTHVNPVEMADLQTLLLTGYRREAEQAMQSPWDKATGGF